MIQDFSLDILVLHQLLFLQVKKINIHKFLKLDLGSSYGTTKSGVGICSMGVLKPDLIMKSVIPVVMAGILGIYGMIVAVILQGKGIFLI